MLPHRTAFSRPAEITLDERVPRDHLSAEMPSPSPSWQERTSALLAFATSDLARQGHALPMFTAFGGDTPLVLATIRPFGSGEATQAVLELLALALPLGADRVALSLPGRAWSLDDPIVPVADDVDLRATVLVLIEADAAHGPCRVESRVYPVDHGPDGPAIADPLEPDDTPHAPLAELLAVLLETQSLTEAHDDPPHDADARLAAQLGRIVLRGHEIALGPGVAARILGPDA